MRPGNDRQATVTRAFVGQLEFNRRQAAEHLVVFELVGLREVLSFDAAAVEIMSAVTLVHGDQQRAVVEARAAHQLGQQRHDPLVHQKLSERLAPRALPFEHALHPLLPGIASQDC